MHLICARCGKDSPTTDCPECGGLAFDVDTPQGREDARNYRGIAEPVPAGRLWLIFFVVFTAYYLGMPVLLGSIDEAWWIRVSTVPGLRPGDWLALCTLPLVGIALAINRLAKGRRSQRIVALDRLIGFSPSPVRFDWRRRAWPWMMVLILVGGLVSQAPELALQPEAFRRGEGLWKTVAGILVDENLTLAMLASFTFAIIARSLEPEIGAWRLVVVWALGGVVGNAGHVLLGGTTPIVGSGPGALAVGGCMLGLAACSRRPSVPESTMWGAPVHPGARAFIFMFMYEVLLFESLARGFVPTVSESAAIEPIPWRAHGCAILLGIAMGCLFALTRRRPEREPPAEPSAA